MHMKVMDYFAVLPKCFLFFFFPNFAVSDTQGRNYTWASMFKYSSCVERK